MPREEEQGPKFTAVYNPIRINWRNVLLGTVIALLIVAIGVFALTNYSSNSDPVPSVEIKTGTNSPKISTTSPQPTDSASATDSSVATTSSQDQ